MNRVHVVSLGCAKNLVDTEVMLALLEQGGYQFVDSPDDSNIILVNTCGFIKPAVEEAVDVILEMAEYKEDNPALLLVVTGCMVQRYSTSLYSELPEVDLLLGVDDFPEIVHCLRSLHDGENIVLNQGKSTYIMDASVPRKLATPFFRAFLKITEGCDNRCTYCMIPSIRGDLRSRTTDDLILEARQLEEKGVKELTLIAQDLTAYGDDLDNNNNIVELVKGLLEKTTVPWIRLLYLYPSSIDDELLHLMAENQRIVPYLDIPFQHVSDNVLRRMNRRYGLVELDQLVQKIRNIVPECALRTTILVGFPGETEEDITLVADALIKWKLEHVGVFQYQDEEGSPAAELAGKIPDEVKEERYNRIMELQAAISSERQQQYVDKIEPVLIEGVSRESDLLLEGRTRFQAPDIDGCVYITSGTVSQGDIAAVRITEAHTYDLVGEVVEP